MKPIHQEHFEAWLFSQPDDRSWLYLNSESCLLCSFLKETGHTQTPSVGDSYWRTRLGSDKIDFPVWLRSFMCVESKIDFWLNKTIITAKMAKDGYRKMFSIDDSLPSPTFTTQEKEIV